MKIWIINELLSFHFPSKSFELALFFCYYRLYGIETSEADDKRNHPT